MTALAEDQAFCSPRDVAKHCRMDYDYVLDQIKAGTIPAEKFGRIYKVPAAWVRERIGTSKPALHVVPDPAPAAAPDFGALASVLEILGAAMVEAAGALRGRSV